MPKRKSIERKFPLKEPNISTNLSSVQLSKLRLIIADIARQRKIRTKREYAELVEEVMAEVLREINRRRK